MRLMVLVQERFDRFHGKHRLVLRHRVHRLHVLFHRHKLVRVVYAQHLKHTPMEHGHVVYLGGLLRQLYDRLVLDNFLRHCGRVRVRHGYDINQAVIGFPRPFVPRVGVVVVIFRGILRYNALQQLQLLLHGVVDAGLD